jgi:hypothetical protein
MRSSAATRKSTRRGLAELVRHGAYLTDGVDLFRVAGVVSGSSGPTTVELENCRTLEMHTYSGHGVMSLGLAPVTARHTHE